MDSFDFKSDKYRIVRELGRGGMGVVYLAEDVLLRRTVALKVLYAHLNRDSSFVSRFQKEAQSVASLHHPNIVYVHGMQRIQDAFVIDMEYIDGLPLDRFLQSPSVAPPVAARIAIDVLEGLQVCHAIGVVHRDIKPANVLLNQAGVAKLGDFGLATAYATHMSDSIGCETTSAFFLGTPRYAAPASWDGMDPVPEWDLYAVGVILYEMISGRVAFPGDTPMAIVRQHLSSRLPPLASVAPHISPAFSDTVDALVALDGTKTATNATDVLRALRDTPEYRTLQEADTATTVQVALRGTKQRPKKRRAPALFTWRPMSITIAVFVAVLGAVGFTTRQSSRPSAGVAPPEVADSGVQFLQPAMIGSHGLENAVWMYSESPSGSGRRIVALHEAGLWLFEMEPSPEEGHFTVAGSWGEYVSPARGSVRFGSIHGAAITTAHGLSLSLTQTNARDNTPVHLHVLASPVREPMDRGAFIEALELNPPVQSLLYNELIPRRLLWAEEIEGMMPGTLNGRVTARRIREPIVVDGLPADDAWQLTAEPDGDGNDADGPWFQSVWTEDAVYLGLHASPANDVTGLEVALQVACPPPSMEAVYFRVAIAEDGDIQGAIRHSTQDVPWECAWESRMSIREGRLFAEIRIPVQSADGGRLTEAGRRWRLNARLVDDSDGPDGIHWGHKRLDAIEHGLIVAFEDSAP